MNRLAVAAGAVSLAQGFPDFACPPELKDGGRGGGPRRHQPVRHHLGRASRSATRSRATTAAPLPRLGRDRPRDPGHRHLRRDRGDDRRDARRCSTRATRSSSSSRSTRTTAPTRSWPARSRATSRSTSRTGRSTRTSCARRSARGRAAIVVNSPHNPTGKVFTRAELELIAGLCIEFDAIAFTDDIYEHIVFEGEHIPLATLPGHGRADRLDPLDVEDVLGHRLADRLDDRAARPVGRDPARPRLPDRRRRGAAAGRGRRRARLPGRLLRATSSPATVRAATCSLPALRDRRLPRPRPGRRLLRDDRHRRPGRDGEDDVAFALRLIRDPGVAAVPGSSFFSRPELGRTKLRFAFPKRLETLDAAAERLASLARRPSDASAQRQRVITRPTSSAIVRRASIVSNAHQRVGLDRAARRPCQRCACRRPGRSRRIRRPRGWPRAHPARPRRGRRPAAGRRRRASRRPGRR